MPDDERIEQLELQNKVLQANNKGLKDTIEELRNENAELQDLLEEKTIRVGFENQENYISKDKIKAKIEELKDGTYDAKIILEQLLEEE